jgi:dUTP pyrophosphatase
MKVDVVNQGINELPRYAKPGDSGMDLRANFSNGLNEDLMWGCAFDAEREVLIMFSGGRCIVPTGLYTAFPPGYEIQVRGRSGLAIKNGIQVLNAPGTIDSSYRGELGVILMNSGSEPFEIVHGDRIAQAILAKVCLVEWNELASLEQLSASDRGKTGFGDSGIK